jgi:triosephosphate isomerase
MRTPVIAGNWKMYKTPEQTLQFIKALLPRVKGVSDREIVICPPFTSLAAAVVAAGGSNVAVGAQDLYWEEEGAFTGEISPAMLTSVGCRYVIIGHSERRAYFGETDATVNSKTKAALAHDLIPIVCVGETLNQREEVVTEEVCRRQIGGGLAGLTPAEVVRLVVAYEPVWAIGTGRTASPGDAQAVIGLLRGEIARLFGREAAAAVRIQYGGSVKPDNIKALMDEPDIDGVLVGGASLNPESFAAIVDYA